MNTYIQEREREGESDSISEEKFSGCNMKKEKKTEKKKLFSGI